MSFAHRRGSRRRVSYGLAAGVLSLLVMFASSVAWGDPSGVSAQDTTRVEYGGPSLEGQIYHVLVDCYGRGADLLGVGDAAGALVTLEACFDDDMVFEAVMPPAYAELDFTTGGGAEGFVRFSDQFYRSLGLVRTQHLLTNLVVEAEGSGRVVARSAGLAVHVFPDESTLNATIRFEDNLELQGGRWKFVRRIMTVTSLTHVPAWSPAF